MPYIRMFSLQTMHTYIRRFYFTCMKPDTQFGNLLIGEERYGEIY